MYNTVILVNKSDTQVYDKYLKLISVQFDHKIINQML